VFFLGEQLHILELKKQVTPSTDGFISWMAIPIPDRHARYSKRLCGEIDII
jgi:hypothetical protein